MVRTQIQVTEQRARRLREQARLKRKSVAEIIRNYIDRGMGIDGRGPQRGFAARPACARAGLGPLSPNPARH